MTHSISFRLNDEDYRKLEKLSKKLHRSKSFIFRNALKVYLNEYADYQIALDRLNDKDDKIVTSEEMKKLIGL